MHDESHPVFFAYRLPKYKNIIPISTSAKSTALLLRFFSRNTIAPKIKDTITLPRLTIEINKISCRQKNRYQNNTPMPMKRSGRFALRPP